MNLTESDQNWFEKIHLFFFNIHSFISLLICLSFYKHDTLCTFTWSLNRFSAPCGEGVYLVHLRNAGAAVDGGAVVGGLQLKESNLLSAFSGLLQPGGAARMKR